MTCVIVDDDKMSRTGLEYLCSKRIDLELIGSFENISEASQAFENIMPDLVLLDIEMPGGTGFELLDKLPVRPNVIIVSSKEHYAYDAFEYEAVDYLKKPVAKQRFDQAIDKITTSEKSHTSLFVRSEGRLIQLQYADIHYVEKIGDYVRFQTQDQSYIVHSTIKSIAERLPAPMFTKVHRSYVVNIQNIVDIEDSSLVIGSKVIPISRGHKQGLINRLNKL